MTIVDPQAARAAIGGLLLAFDKNQRRGEDGKWIKMGGGLASNPGRAPFDGKARAGTPRRLSAREFEQQVPPDRRFYRGVGSVEGAEATKSGQIGGGDFGPGVYMDPRIATAQGYARSDGGRVLRIGLAPGVKPKRIPQRVRRSGSAAINEWATEGKFDAISTGDGLFVIVRNPDVLIADDRNYTKRESVVLEYLARGYTMPEGYQPEIEALRRDLGIEIPDAENYAAFKTSSEVLEGPGAIGTPGEPVVAGETTGDATTTALRARAALAVMELFGFNPHQLRGPDGKFIKMPASQLRNRRNERARARRAEKKAAAAGKVESDAPDQAGAAHRRNRDDFNRKVAVEAVNAQNDNEFDGRPDAKLDNALEQLQKAIQDDEPTVADDWADDLHGQMADGYPDADLPVRPIRQAEPPSVQIDEAAIKQQFDDATDDYHAEIHVMGKAWVDMLRDPEVRADPDSGLDHVDDRFVNELGSTVLALRKNILGGERLMAKLNADLIRRLLVGLQLQAEHDFPQKPTLEEMRRDALNQARGIPQPPNKTSGLLTSGAPITARQAALQAAAEAGVWGDEPIGQGAMGETKKVVFNDGTRAIYKRAMGDWSGSTGGEPWTPTDQTDAEEMASLVGAALGLRAPAVQRISDDEINMEMVENAVPAMNRYYDRDASEYVRVPDDVIGSDEGLLMGLFDTLIDNPDRHGFNWMVDDANRLYPIDHGLAFMNLRGSGQSVAARSPFATEYFVTPGGRYKENILSKRDIEYVRQQLAPLQDRFTQIGKHSWGVAMGQRLDHLSRQAKGGASHQLPAPREEQQ